MANHIKGTTKNHKIPTYVFYVIESETRPSKYVVVHIKDTFKRKYKRSIHSNYIRDVGIGLLIRIVTIYAIPISDLIFFLLQCITFALVS